MRIGTEERALTRDGERFFYLGDTAWTAFADARPDEWTYFLDYRRRQGFNAVQVSLLPIPHDRSLNPETDPAFDLEALQERSRWQFNDRYFARALQMVDEAATKRMACTLVVVWCSYMAGTWAAKRAPEFVMPDEVLVDYLARCRDLVLRPNVVLLASGDSTFVDPEEEAFYGNIIEWIRHVNPAAVVGCHLQPRALLPASLDKMVDLFTYQSGHHVGEQSLAWRLARYYSGRLPARPIIDMEPCYEGHALGGLPRRFTAEDVRRVVWQSIVAGATAGAGYGAHGVWQWHRTGSTFNNAKFSGEPVDWRDALHFVGARDMAFCRRIMEAEQLVGREHVLIGHDDPAAAVESLGNHIDGTDDILAAHRADDQVAGLAYVAAGQQIRLPAPLSNISDIRAIDLRERARSELSIGGSTDRDTTVTAGPASGDVVIIWK